MSPLIESLLWKLGATSVQTAVLTLAVWGLCRGVKRLPAATQTWLWWLVGVQAVVGLLWSSPVQLPVLPAHTFASALGGADTLVPVATAAAAASTAANASATAHAMDATVWSSWAVWLFAVWAAGVLVIAAGTLRAYWRSRALVRAAQPCTDKALVQSLQMAAEAHGLSRPPALRLSSQIDSPQLIGPWQPVLLLPARRLPQMADDDLDMALTHELIHLRRRDLWLGLLPSLAQHLFFFHPLVHLAARKYAIAREAACDAAVVAGHRHCRHDYGRLLLQFGVSPRPLGGVASASPSFLSLKRRLVMLQDTSAFPRLAAALILATVAVAGVMPLRLVAMPAPVTSTSMRPIVVSAPAARAQGSSAADAAAPMSALPAPALPAAPAAPASHGVIADVLGAESLPGADVDATQNGWDELDRVSREAAATALRDAQDAMHALGTDNSDLERRQEQMQDAQDALQEAREQLASLGPELAQAKQDAQQQAREAEQQIREMAQQHRQAQYAYAAAVRQAAALSRQQAEMGKQAARQARIEAARGQQQAAQAQREAAQAQADAEQAQAEAEQAQNN
ncbi:M56 family metallopeptidase [Xanthomonas campestris]|uniref:M56 family metallopeptidase n=1 Tax=Xanthomonas campestris TaxID=339 RepID=UPI002378589B|nr:M56 family metallopeptidase [Xanthomonas campestris]WDL54394.1 M56 family metallopeptidase [Xanthomonas campestris pv. campestris]